MNGLGLELLVIFALTLLNGLFSGAEIAVLSSRKTRLQQLAEKGHRGARTALRLRADPERFLATVQVGITVLGAAAGAFGGAVLEEPIATLLRNGGVGQWADSLAFAAVVAVVSMLSIVFGELVPKSIALRSAEPITLAVSGPLHFMSRAARPVVWMLTGLSNLILRPFRDRTTFTESRLSPEELQQLVGEATAAGTVDHETGQIAARAIDLGRLHAYSVMIPRNEVTWMSPHASGDAVRALLKAQPHARYPVLDSDEHVLGYVLAHDVYDQLLDDRLELARILRELPAYPEQATAVEILRALQAARSEIGVIVDENGLPSGLVSIETLAEELFGEILAEHEKPSMSIAPAGQSTDAKLYSVRGDMPLHELNRELDIDLPIDAAATTLGGLIVAHHGGCPARGTRVVLPGGVRAEVVEASPRRVLLARLEVSASRESD